MPSSSYYTSSSTSSYYTSTSTASQSLAPETTSDDGLRKELIIMIFISVFLLVMVVTFSYVSYRIGKGKKLNVNRRKHHKKGKRYKEDVRPVSF